MRSFSAAILTLVIPCCAFGQTYTIKTFAGGGLPVNIRGTSASLHSPGSVAVDRAGNLFFADQRHVVLRLDATTGVLALAAGNGTLGFSGDNGPATSAQLFSPSGVAVDAAGNLYIADSGNHRIRKVSNGVTTTVAGNGTQGFSGDKGLATSARLFFPTGVAVDSAGNLYIADRGNNRIRKVANGVITTVAGNGTLGFSGDNGPATSAQLFLPASVAVDAAGNLYIADSGNDRVRKVRNGVITTVAGGGAALGDTDPATSARLSSPSGVAVDAAGNLYIADYLSYRVRKVSNGEITTVAGNGTRGFSGDNGPATSAQLFLPSGVAVDAAGNLYIADSGDFVIRKVSSKVITTVAGNGTRGFGGDNGLATSAQLYDPKGVAVDAAGNLYIADSSNLRIRKVSSMVITTVAGSGTLGFSGDNGPAAGAQLNDPKGVAVDSAGNLYIADSGNQRIRKVSNGVITTVAGTGRKGFSGDNGPAAGAQLNDPKGVAVDSAGNLYIADSGNDRIRKISNGVITTAAGSGTRGFSGDNGSATSARLNDPQGVAVDSAGNLYIADSGNQRIRKVSNGMITTVAENETLSLSGDTGPATSARLNNPQGVAVDAAGNLYIADSGYVLTRKVSSRVITAVAGNGTRSFSGDNGPATSAGLNDPQDVAVDAARNLYIADGSNHRIRVLIPSSASCSVSVTPLALSPGAAGGSLTVTVKTGSSCAWAIQSLPDWITFYGSAVTTGPGNVTLSVAANPGAPRAATISIGGVSVPVTQQGPQRAR